MDPRNNIATDLFYKIRSRFTNLKLGNEMSEITIVPEEARFFDFNYVDGSDELGHVTISIAEPKSLKMYFSSGIADNMDKFQKQRWFDFLKEMRVFAKRRMLSFDTRDISKDNLSRRDYKFLSLTAKKLNQNRVVGESKMFGSTKSSYQKMENTRLIVRHNKTLADDIPGARARNISAIYIENADGERFKYPVKHLAGARAMQRHFVNDGLLYDDIGKSIIEMSDNIAKLKKFKRFSKKDGVVNETNQPIVEKVSTALESLKKTVTHLSSQKHYESYVQSFNPSVSSVSETELSSIKQQFPTNDSINEVFPVIHRIMNESVETSCNMPSGKVNVSEIAEFIHSFYDKETRTFPKGPEGVCIMVKKQFGEQAEQVARSFVNRMAPAQSSITEDEVINELDYDSFTNRDDLQALRDAIDSNVIVSVAFVKKDNTVRAMAIKKFLSAYVPSSKPKSELQANVEQNHDLKRVIDINAYKQSLKNV